MGPRKQFQNTRIFMRGLGHATSKAKDIYSPVEINVRLLISHARILQQIF
jgi:hypothetical protein